MGRLGGKIMNEPEKISEKVSEVENIIGDFVRSFELVFDNDWDFTKSSISDEYFIAKGGTFINPKVSDESNNSANRGSLLDSYRRLIKVLDKYNIPHSVEDFFN
jgi:hypothetical protein